jgi:lysophospholipase L1-like esterase
MYRTLSVIALNSLLLLVLINLVSSALLGRLEAGEKRAGLKTLGMRFSFRGYDPRLSRVYPEMAPDQVDELLKEFTRLRQMYEPYTQFRTRPPISKYIEIVAPGFRSIRNQAPWPPQESKLNIFVFGGSTTFGWGVRNIDTIPSFMGERFSRSKGKAVSVYNFGRCSYFCTQERILLEKLIMDGHYPDIAVFIDGLNDGARLSGDPAFTERLAKLMDEPEIDPWVRVVYALPVVKLALRLVGPNQSKESKNKTPDPDMAIRSIVSRYSHNKTLVEAISEKYHIKTLFVWQPVASYNYNQKYNIFGDFNYEAYQPVLNRTYLKMKELHGRGKFGDNFLWLGDMQKDLKVPLYVDAYHYSAQMNNRVAERVCNGLLSLGYIPYEPDISPAHQPPGPGED